jgi:hypothetical protein
MVALSTGTTPGTTIPGTNPHPVNLLDMVKLGIISQADYEKMMASHAVMTAAPVVATPVAPVLRLTTPVAPLAPVAPLLRYSGESKYPIVNIVPAP